jgi:hypothetical protein
LLGVLLEGEDFFHGFGLIILQCKQFGLESSDFERILTVSGANLQSRDRTTPNLSEFIDELATGFSESESSH